MQSPFFVHTHHNTTPILSDSVALASMKMHSIVDSPGLGENHRRSGDATSLTGPEQSFTMRWKFQSPGSAQGSRQTRVLSPIPPDYTRSAEKGNSKMGDPPVSVIKFFRCTALYFPDRKRI